MRAVGAALIVLVASGVARAARLDVELPSAGDVLVYDRGNEGDGTRISCPPDCTHSDSTISLEMRVDVQLDPVTKDEAWDIVSLDGCDSFTTLPAPSAICRVDSTGNTKVRVELRYRPILAVTFTGTINVPLSGLNVQSGFGPGYQGSGSSFACDATNPAPQRCARHYTWNQPVRLEASQSVTNASFVDMSEPCEGSPSCGFVILADTCVTVTYAHVSEIFPKATLSGPSCPTGGGGGGGGGGTTTIPTTPTTSTTLGKEDVVDDILQDIVDSLPLLIPPLRLPFFAPERGTVTAAATATASAEARAAGPKETVLLKAKRRVRKLGESTLKVRSTKAGRRLFAQGAPVLATVTVRFRSRSGTTERTQLVTVPGTTPQLAPR